MDAAVAPSAVMLSAVMPSAVVSLRPDLVAVVSPAGTVELRLAEPVLLVAQRLVDGCVLAATDTHLLLFGCGEIKRTELAAVPTSLMACEVGIFVGFSDGTTSRYDSELVYQCRFKADNLFWDDRSQQVRAPSWVKHKLELDVEVGVDNVVCCWPLLVCRLDGALAVYDRARRSLTRFPSCRPSSFGVRGRTVSWADNECLVQCEQ
jgi:hypothetical protein